MTLTYVTLSAEWVKIISILITLTKFFLPSCTQFPSVPSSLAFPFYRTLSLLSLFILLWGKKEWLRICFTESIVLNRHLFQNVYAYIHSFPPPQLGTWSVTAWAFRSSNFP